MDEQGTEDRAAWEGELYRLLAENVLDYAIFVVDPEGRVQTWTVGAERLLGYREDEIVGQPADVVFTPEDIEKGVPQQELRNALTTGRGEDDRWHVRRDGTRFWSNGVMTPLCNEDGTLRGFAKILQDRTDRKRTDEALRDALAYAESIVETVREPLLVLDAELRVWTANRSFCRTFQVTEVDTQGRLIYELGNGQWDIPRLRTLLEEVVPQNTSFDDYEVEHDFPGIGRRSMQLNARKLYREQNHTELILLAIEDETEGRRAEERRLEVETRFTSLVKNVRDHSIFTTDTQGHITSWNVEAERILGFSEAQALGQHFSIIFTPEDVEQGVPQQELDTARREGRAEDERWHRRKDGERFWALGIVTPTQDAHGGHTGFSKILRDMTDRKRAELALREADRLKDEFLAMLAHELRNPLTPVCNGLELLALRGTDRDVVGIMRLQVEHLVRLVDDLLDVSRIMRGRIELRRQRVDLASVTSRAVEMARPVIDEHGHGFTAELPYEPVVLDADPVRLAQVIGNLLTNAAKYTEHGGRIRLTAHREQDEVLISVRDTGVGIDPELLPHVFDLFRQSERSLDRSQGGMGIGLTVVKRLVEMHGGTVSVASEGPGRGSEFTVRLPVSTSASAEAPPEPEREREPPPSRRCRVLVVDDNVGAAKLLGLLVAKLGEHSVRTAHSGRQALRLAAEERPDVILLDVGLPEMSGHEVVRLLRQTPELEATLVVAVTGYGTAEDRRQALEAGFDEHLVKPPALDTLRTLFAHPKLNGDATESPTER